MTELDEAISRLRTAVPSGRKSHWSFSGVHTRDIALILAELDRLREVERVGFVRPINKEAVKSDRRNPARHRQGREPGAGGVTSQ